MNIQTKFDIGDTPFCLHNNFPVKIEITNIDISFAKGFNEPYIMYTGEFLDLYGRETESTHKNISEKNVYSSIEEMKEQLFKDI